MILVDTSVWIDHLHEAEARLVELLDADAVGFHPSVVEELALGQIKGRAGFLDLLRRLRPFSVLSHDELMSLVDLRHLWGRGLSPTDARLIGSVLLAPDALLWTRDRRLNTVAAELAIPLVTE